MTDKTNVQQSTTVSEVDLDIDSWLGAPGAESIITQTEPSKEEKPNVLSPKTGTDVSFLDKEEDEEVSTSTDKNEKVEDVSRESSTSSTDIFDELEEDPASQPEDRNKGGRPKTEKSGLVEFLKKRIESKEMFAFDDFDESKQSLDEYLGSLSEKDVDELWQANIDNIKKEVADQTPKEFFESLPEELQYAAKYALDGGTDMKGLFKVLSQVEEIRELNPEQEADQEVIIRNYLKATNFGTEDEIDEQVAEWKDLGTLGKRAKTFKPKLDQMQEEIVQQKLQEQESRKKQQEEAAQQYMNSVFEALRPGEINGLKLDKKTQAALYNGLVQPNYPSISGRPTNLLGHLLEKYQFVEPNYGLIAEALWLLQDPDGYRKTLRQEGGNQQTEKIARQLKTEQSRKISSTVHEETDPRTSRKIPRQTNIFKR